METLDDAIEHICDLKGHVIAQGAVILALLKSLPGEATELLLQELQQQREGHEAALLHSPISETTRAAFDRVLHPFQAEIERRAVLQRLARGPQQ